MKFALLGNKINYSLSPLIYNYWFGKYGINASYEIIDIPLEGFNGDFINDLFYKNKYKAVNVTKPFKEKAICFVDKLSNEVNFIQSVNNITLDKGYLKAYNTDYIGLLDSFLFHKINIREKNTLILGAGGTARSLIYALREYYCNIFIKNRSLNNAINISKLFKGNSINILNFEDYIDVYNVMGKSIDIIFNCSSGGVDEYLKTIPLNKNIIFYDVNYHNGFVIDNVNFYNGIMMLIFQASHNFRLWFGFLPNIDEDLILLVKEGIK